MQASGGGKHKFETDIPMKMRRRQSDAKWRANVASCYETLKHIIPVNKRASKRQISKAVILQETSKHIHFLENILRTLLQEKAEKCGVGDQQEWVDNEVADIQTSFEKKLGEKMDVMNHERRYKRNRYKRYISENMMKESIQNTASVRSVIFEQKAAEQQPKKKTLSNVAKTLKKKMRSTTRAPAATSVAHDEMRSFQEVPDLIDVDGYSMDSLNGPVNNDLADGYVPVMPVDLVPEAESDNDMHIRHDIPSSYDLSIVSTLNVSEAESDNDMDVKEVCMIFGEVDNSSQNRMLDDLRFNDVRNDPMIPAPPPCTPVKATGKALSTPLKHSVHQDNGIVTPVKLPQDWTLCPLTPAREHGTPRNAFFSPSSCGLRSDLESDCDEQSLLCQEDMWLSDDEQDQSLGRLEQTPRTENKHTSLRDVKFRARRKRKRCNSLSSEQSDSQPNKLPRTDNEPMELKTPTCRRSLDLNVKQEPAWDKQDLGQKDFDGYMYFYKQMASQLENMETDMDAEKISRLSYDLWQELPESEKKTITEMAVNERDNKKEVNDCKDFEEAFYQLRQEAVKQMPKMKRTKPLEIPFGKVMEGMKDSGQSALNTADFSEDIKPILPLSPWKSSSELDGGAWGFSDVSPLFGTSLDSMLTHIKVEKQE